MSVDRDADLAYIAMKREIAPGEVVRQVTAGSVVLDFGDSGQLLGVELMNADELLPSEMRF
ncbi:DUF2283 domain-containing protein [Nonomuraea antimicrobica]